jgi:hypothetical protein
LTDQTNPAPSQDYVGDGGLTHFAAAPQPHMNDPVHWTPPAGFRMSGLTPEQQGRLRAAASDPAPNAMRNAWRDILDGHRSGPAPATAAPAQPAPAAPASQLDPDAAWGSNLADRLGEVLGDADGADALLETLSPQLERAATKIGQLSADEIEANWQRVAQYVYRGSGADQEAGVAFIAQALHQIGGPELVELVEGAQLLSDPNTHMQLLALSRQITRQR